MTLKGQTPNRARLATHPSLGPSQAGRAANSVTTHLRVNVSLDNLAIESDLRSSGWKEATVHSDFPPRDHADWGRQHVGFDKVVPGKGDDILVTLDAFCPEGVDIPAFVEFRLNDRRVLVGEVGKENGLDGSLQPSGHGDVVRVYADLVIH